MIIMRESIWTASG